MATVTSKLQVTVPKTIAARYRIRPGDEIEWRAAGAVIEVVPPDKQTASLSLDARLKLFDAATVRQQHRQASRKRRRAGRDRRRRREDLYVRGRAR